MKKIRIGNDIAVEWRVYADGVPFQLAGKDIVLSVEHDAVRTYISEMKVTGNVLTFIYRGEEQRACGLYNIVLRIGSGDALRTIDVLHAFMLVPHSALASEGDTSLSFASEIVVGELVQPEVLRYSTAQLIDKFHSSAVVDMFGKTYFPTDAVLDGEMLFVVRLNSAQSVMMAADGGVTTTTTPGPETTTTTSAVIYDTLLLVRECAYASLADGQIYRRREVIDSVGAAAASMPATTNSLDSVMDEYLG